MASAAPLLLGGLSARVRLQAQQPAHRIRVGHNLTTYISGGRGPDGFWQGVEELASVGVRGTEADNRQARLSETYEQSPSQVRDRLAKNNMECVALYYNPTTLYNLSITDSATREENLKRGMAIGRFLKAIGGSILNFAGGTRPEPSPAAAFAEFGKLLNELGKRLRDDLGIRLGIHPHRGHLVENAEDIARAMDSTRPEFFSLCPDTGHLLAAGADPLTIFRTYRSRIIYTHYKDYDPNLVSGRGADGRRGGFTELGKGAVDFKGITDLLRTTGYDGWAMIELDRAPAAPIDAVKANLQYMSETLKLQLR